jgi:CHAT domain-containing protein/tetratricopeptide (TPR) repeat protein
LSADDDARRALGWALKDEAYGAMYTDLARAQAGAERLRDLAAGACEEATRRELRALADWVAGAALALQGQAQAAVEQLDAAADAFIALGQPQHAASAQVPKVAALAMLGRHDDALACAEQALAQLDAAGDVLAAGKVEINLGSMLLRQDRYADAAAHYRRAAVRFARIGERRHSVMADIGLAGALSWQYQFDEALRIYERAQQRAQAHGLDNLVGVIHSSRGLMELRRGRHADALRWLEAALRDAEARGPPQRLADARAELADAYLALNLLPEAAAMYDAAIDGCRANDAPIEQAWATAQLALALARMGRTQEALAPIAQARALFDAQGNAVGAAWLDVQAAALRLAAGDAHAALALADAAAAAFADAGMRGWRLDAQVLAGQAQAAAGDAAAAQARLRAVLADAEGLPELQARALSALGALLRAAGDIRRARARYEQAAQAIEAQQAALHDDEFRTAYASDKQSAFDALTELALDGECEPSPAALLACMERARARSLALALARPQIAADHAAAAWREPLHWLQQQWQQAIAAGETARAAALQQRAAALEAEALAAHRRAQSARAAPQTPARAAAAFSLAALQARLGAQEALVEYAWLADERLIAVVVRRDHIAHALLDARGLDERITQLRFQIDSLRFGGAVLRSAAHAAQIEARARAHLRALHAQVWAPLVPALEGATQVIVVPHRALHYLPFCALDDGRQVLIERHAVTLAPSAALWCAGARAAPGRPGRALVLGVGGAALPHVRAEVDAVAAALGPRAIALLDGDATLARMRSALEAPVSVLHLACHGQFRADSPYFSSLALADGALTLRDAAALPLADAFVALSACETGMSRIAPGDELLGLVRGFLRAGAPAVMATLWTVDDAGTGTLMADFYRRLSTGQPPAHALRLAQLALRERRPHPYHWAPFALHGRV